MNHLTDGIVTLDCVETELDGYFQNGYPKGDAIGFPAFDKLLTFRAGEVTTLTGIPGHGKSELLDEILVRLSQRHGWRHGLYAAENGGWALHYSRLLHRLNECPFVQMNPGKYATGKTFLKEHVYYINNRKVKTITAILETSARLVERYGIRSITIDPWNCMDSERPAYLSETEYVSWVYSQLVDFAQEYDVHVFLVAHPVKMAKDKEGYFEVPNLYSISGSANFFNKTFNGLCVYRDYEKNQTLVYVQKVKFDFVGNTGMSAFTYDPFRRRYSEVYKP
jgi:twinkle protein